MTVLNARPIDLRSIACTFVAGKAIAPGRGVLIASIDELYEQREPHSLLISVDEGRAVGALVPANCCSVDARLAERRVEAVFLGEDGELWRFDGLAFRALPPVLGATDLQGPLRSICIAPWGYLAIGSALQAYGSADLSAWQPIDSLLAGEKDLVHTLGYERICIAGEDVAIAVGWKGLGARFHRRMRAERLDLPTNLDLYDVAATANGEVYACGDEGIVLRGDANAWRMIPNDITGERFWGVAAFAQRRFVSSMHMLYEVKPDGLQQVDYADEDLPPSYTYRLSTGEDVLWSIGTKQLVEFDGKNWRELIALL